MLESVKIAPAGFAASRPSGGVAIVPELSMSSSETMRRRIPINEISTLGWFQNGTGCVDLDA
jgi:hypothetical protein